MDRQIVYSGAIPLDTDQLSQNKNVMIGLGMALRALLGTGTWFDGLACTPTGPASLQVLVGPGSVYALENVDSTAYGSLGSDTAHQIVKQGINLGTLTLSCPAPGTTGQSINYLIQSAYQDTDTGAAVLPYYNSSNPSVAYNGPGNSGTSQNTVRAGQCLVAVKAGVAATTGSQTTPAPDAGYTGLWVVTVANGQTTITSGNIALAPSAPFISEKLNDKISIATGDGRYLRIGTAAIRQRLIANTTFYVNASTGSDSNTGFSSGAAWQTIQHAINYIQQNIDCSGFQPTISVADGTYTGGIAAYGEFAGVPAGGIQIIGNTTTPSNCIISTTSQDAVDVAQGATISIAGFKLQTTTSGNCLAAFDGGRIYTVGAMNFGACANAHISANKWSYIAPVSPYTISGSAAIHWQISDNAVLSEGNIAITLSGTPAFSSGFAIVSNGGVADVVGLTFSGSATGTRYSVTTNGVINTNGGGATYLPGSVGGATSTGGQYA